jgi:hypothetical protein
VKVAEQFGLNPAFIKTKTTEHRLAVNQRKRFKKESEEMTSRTGGPEAEEANIDNGNKVKGIREKG